MPTANVPLPPYPEGNGYYGPFVAETLTGGWCYGAITEFLRPDLPDGCESGDGFAVAPDGSYCGLVWWRDCPWTCKRIRRPRSDGSWGVFEVRFPIAVRSTDDLTANFRSILPRLRREHRDWSGLGRSAPQFLGQPRTAVLRLPDSVRLRASPETFWSICSENPDLRLERAASGRIEVLPPVGLMTSSVKAAIAARLETWTRATGLGVALGSDAGYTLPNGAVRSPDASWTGHDRFPTLTEGQRERFVPCCPTFAVELRSWGDRTAPLRRKMREYREQGTRLGWLIDLPRRRVEVYRRAGSVERLADPGSLSGGDVLPGFELELDEILADLPRVKSRGRNGHA